MKFVSNWIGGLPSPTADVLDDVNPATGKLIARIPRSQADDVHEAVVAAREGARVWAAAPATERAQALRRIADAIEARVDELAALESQDQGKPASLARRVDIPRAISNFRFFASALDQEQLQSTRMADAINYEARKPIGIVGLITPWNLPLYLLSWKVAPALAMGNAIVAKPSELTPLTADALAEICADILPPGVFNLVHGLGPECGQAIVEHPEIKAISFTGGTTTGRIVARTAAPMFKKLSLELGGKNATVVFADADFSAAVTGARIAGFANQGEICLCGSRILVERSIHDRFVEALKEQVGALVVGDPADPATDVGALNSFAHRDKVEGYLALAREEGGDVFGGDRPDLPGAFLRPAVVTGLAPTCRTATEEIFGPVVTVHAFDSEDDAVAIANGTEYGLAASVWTSNLGRAHRVSEALDVGMVWVNTWLHRDLRVPFGGVKNSGVGREGGRWSMAFYSENKNICIHLGEPR